MPTFKVGVFTSEGKRGKRYRAYVRDYNPRWSGCRVYTVAAASNGEEAKAAAIACARIDDLRAKEGSR